MSSKIDVNWEEDDGSFEKLFASKQGAEAEEFFSLMESSQADSSQSFNVGDKVTATISHIAPDGMDVIIELGRKSSGVMEKQELLDEQGVLKVKAGDQIQAYIVSRRNGEYILSTSLSATVSKDDALEQAYDSGMPVKGKVIKENKGGFEISVLGKTGFCPVSQIDTKFVDDKSGYIGKEFDFLITKLERRNVVLSRSELLKRLQKENIERIKSELKPGAILEGTVDSIKPFGVMVDIGGVTGMVHISEVSHSRLVEINDAVRVGQKVRVKLLSVGNEEPNPRIALSLKQVEGDPWDLATDRITVEGSYNGKVVRLETFGAFVELEPGIEGLIHISEMSWEKRIHHPKDVLAVGDTVSVRVLSIDSLKKRISLTMKAVGDDPWLKVETTYNEGTTHKAQVQSLKGFGAIVEISAGLTGMLPMGTIKKVFGESYKKHVSPPRELDVVIAKIEKVEKKILLTLPNIESENDDSADVMEYMQKAQQVAQNAKTNQSLGSFGALLQNSFQKNK